MTRTDRSQWPLTSSQQAQYEAIRVKMAAICGQHRPFLLTGEVGVGKTFLARRLADGPVTYYNIARDHLPQLLADHNLPDLTPGEGYWLDAEDPEVWMRVGADQWP